MQTDLDKFKELYRSVGVDFQVDTKLDPFSSKGAGAAEYYIPSGSTVLLLIEGWSQGVIGHAQCETEIYFDKNGKFICQGIWG